MGHRSTRQTRHETAGVTLTRAARFLGAGLATVGERADAHSPRAIEGACRAKVIGNSLRELDRFLNLLIDEKAALLAPEGFDHAGFARRRNAASKLRDLHAMMPRPVPQNPRAILIHDHLRRIGRWRDCMFHCGGVVRRRYRRIEDQGAVAIGDRLVLTPNDLTDICLFYEDVAADLA